MTVGRVEISQVEQAAGLAIEAGFPWALSKVARRISQALINADIAQLVERDVANVKVRDSNSRVRSRFNVANASVTAVQCGGSSAWVVVGST